MTWHVHLSDRAGKELLSIEKRQRLMLLRWIANHLEGCENPKAIPGVKKLVGTHNYWRYRVGSYRVICILEDGTLIIEVIQVGHRQQVYRNLPKS